MRTTMIAGAVALALTTNAARSAAQAPELKWGPAPAVFAAGAKMAVLQGDPSKTAMFTIRLDLPDGYAIAPHWHPTDEHVTVIEGTFMVGMGDKVDAAKMLSLPAGGFITAPAPMHHYGRAKGHTIVQVSAMGPFAMTYVNPADDPSKHMARR
ncbi:MAG TPA: cupin domain-containing protein [Gemmatimonadaceae bacterium]|nr:cupin domain-containing protein [Gemmatimonadaceae bacterium]